MRREKRNENPADGARCERTMGSLVRCKAIEILYIRGSLTPCTKNYAPSKNIAAKKVHAHRASHSASFLRNAKMHRNLFSSLLCLPLAFFVRLCRCHANFKMFQASSSAAAFFSVGARKIKTEAGARESRKIDKSPAQASRTVTEKKEARAES
jgi:hypothetical protein